MRTKNKQYYSPEFNQMLIENDGDYSESEWVEIYNVFGKMFRAITGKYFMGLDLKDSIGILWVHFLPILRKGGFRQANLFNYFTTIVFNRLRQIVKDEKRDSLDVVVEKFESVGVDLDSDGSENENNYFDENLPKLVKMIESKIKNCRRELKSHQNRLKLYLVLFDMFSGKSKVIFPRKRDLYVYLRNETGLNTAQITDIINSFSQK